MQWQLADQSCNVCEDWELGKSAVNCGSRDLDWLDGKMDAANLRFYRNFPDACGTKKNLVLLFLEHQLNILRKPAGLAKRPNQDMGIQ
jgi:hypothetical protein